MVLHAQLERNFLIIQQPFLLSLSKHSNFRGCLNNKIGAAVLAAKTPTCRSDAHVAIKMLFFATKASPLLPQLQHSLHAEQQCAYLRTK